MKLPIFIATIICLLGDWTAADAVNGVDVNQACKQNEAIARMYCRDGNEPPSVKPKCDMYRKYCSNINPPAAPLPANCQQLSYCKRYAGQNSLICSNAAFADSSSDKRMFCSNYKRMCDNIEADPNDACGLKANADATVAPLRAAPSVFAGAQPNPGLHRLTDLNGGGPMATVGQSSIDNIRENMASSAAAAPLFGMLGKFAGLSAAPTAESNGQAPTTDGGDPGSLSNGLLSGLTGGTGTNPSNPSGPALGMATIPGFDAASQRGPIGTSPLVLSGNTGIGPFASFGKATSINQFGKVGWGKQWGAMGFSGYNNAGGVDFGSVPGLTDFNNPLVGGKRRRRRRETLKAQRINDFYRFLFKS